MSIWRKAVVSSTQILPTFHSHESFQRTTLYMMLMIQFPCWICWERNIMKILTLLTLGACFASAVSIRCKDQHNNKVFVQSFILNYKKFWSILLNSGLKKVKIFKISLRTNGLNSNRWVRWSEWTRKRPASKNQLILAKISFFSNLVKFGQNYSVNSLFYSRFQTIQILKI